MSSAAATATVDTTLNCDPIFMQLTVGAIPATPQLVTQSSLPFGLCVHPLAQHRSLPKEVPLVDFGTTGVIRCKRCRTYINPFVTFSDGGRRCVSAAPSHPPFRPCYLRGVCGVRVCELNM